MNKDPNRDYNFTFNFIVTHFSGLTNEGEPRSESFSVRARDFDGAIEQLKQKLHDFRGSNSFCGFTVETDQSVGGAHIGFRTVSINPDPLFNIYGVLRDASFILR